MIKTCEVCGKEIHVFPCREKIGAGRFCSVACRNAGQVAEYQGEKNRFWEGGKIKRTCDFCGKEFDVFPSRIKHGNAKFCSRACVCRWRVAQNRVQGLGANGAPIQMAVTKKCLNCGAMFIVSPRYEKEGRGLFCSRDCFGEYTKETGRYAGKQNPNWRGGITDTNLLLRASLEYQEWREKVFERDGWTCRECGAKREVGSVVLHAHHVKEFATHPEMRLDVSNGLTLCEPCHMALHGLNCLARERQFGEKNPNHKLTWEQVGEIRARHVQGTLQKTLAQEFGITQAHVSAIVLGKSWNRGSLDE